ncbi:MAG: SUMF1/EgtB/PvdO family nonheme iron enzyme [Anaerolineae bacterium]|nr:SUMF1/EgtB/PvdO family nonheme iron enzyme [Anaerolineae bacterium]
MNWSSAIQQGLDSGELLIVVISPDSMTSRNVEDEWQYYLDHGKAVVPVLLEPAKIHFQLNRLQYIDFHTQPFDIAINHLYAELRRKGLQLAAPVQPQPPSGPALPSFDNLSPEEIDHVLTELQKRRQQFDTSAAVPYPPARPAPSSSRRWLMGGALGLLAIIAIAMVALQGLGAASSQTPTPPTATNNVQALPTATPTLPPPTAPATLAPTTLPTEPPGLSAANPITRNADWKPRSRTHNGIEMVLVPTGKFLMGTSLNDADSFYRDCQQFIANCRGSRLFDDESPTVEVAFDRPFWIGRYEVTNQQYTGSGDNRPRANVTWQEAQAFCEGQEMRLPTEREWEYASRGPDALDWPWGEFYVGPILNYCDQSCDLDVGWKDTSHNDGYAEAAPVGSFAQGDSWVGAADMAGNLWEWTSTIYRSHPADGYEDPGDPEASRTLKGSSWNWVYQEGRGAARSAHAANAPSSPWYGFRCARDFDPADLS